MIPTCNPHRRVLSFRHVVLICVLLIGFIQPLAAQWLSRGYAGGEVDVTSPNVIYRADNSLFKSQDAGMTWQLIDKTKFTNWTVGQSLIFETGAVHIHFLDNTTGFYFGSNLLGTHRVIFRTIDGGLNWTLVHAAIGGQIQQISFISLTQGFAIGDFGQLLKTTDAGVTWTVVPTPVTHDFNAIATFDNTHTLIVAAGQSIIKSTNGGSSWVTTVMPDEVLSLSFRGDVGVAITREQLYRTTNGGETWTPEAVNIPVGTRFSHVRFFNNNYGYLSTDAGLYQSGDGKFWSLQHSVGEATIESLDFQNEYGFLITSVSFGFKDYYSSNNGDPMPADEAEVLEIKKERTDQCRGNYAVQARMINRGTHPLQTTTLHFTVDGVEQTPLQWTGNLISGDTSEWITVGHYAYTKTGRAYAIMVRSENPNGVPDEYTPNDVANLTQSFDQFSGTYTIGSRAGSDFSNLSTPINLLQQNGMCDSVTFNIEPGSYADEFNLNYIPYYAGQLVRIQSITRKPEDVVIEASGEGFPSQQAMMRRRR